MPDDKKIKGPADQKKINVNEPYEVKDWSKSLGVSQDDLKKIVNVVGPSADAVRRYIEQHKK